MLHHLLSQMLSERLSQATRIAALYAIQAVVYRHQPAQSALVHILMPSMRMQITVYTNRLRVVFWFWFEMLRLL